MATRKPPAGTHVRDDDLRLRPGRIRSRRAPKAKGFVAQVLAAAQKSGHTGRRPAGARSTFGRGRVAAWRAERVLLSDRSRRVIVKARVVRHRGVRFRAAPLSAHLGYLKREGVTRDGERARMFDAGSDEADDRAFARRCEGDRHHFRFTVSPEDAADMTDLRAFTRDLLANMERDLGTTLDWAAVDHWNTDNPHVHVILRGRAQDGGDLVISRDYISRGMRARAAELVTLELGPRSEYEIRTKLAGEVDTERWTRLDSVIAREAAGQAGVVDLRPEPSQPGDPVVRTLMIGRLQRLERMGLARPLGPAQWLLAEEAEPALRDLGLRGDIVKTMHRALKEQGAERPLDDYAIHRDPRDIPVRLVGRVVAKGLHDELAGSAYLVVDGADGRVHHVPLRGVEDLARAPVEGGVVELRRIEPGEGGRGGIFVRALSDLPLDRQVTAAGATWLDRELVGREKTALSDTGFGAEARAAVAARTEHLIQEGLARRQAARVIFAQDLLGTLTRRELDAAAARIAQQTGLERRVLVEGDRASGTCRQRLDLVSGRFAMLDDGLGFQLVPWSDALEKHLDQQVSGVVLAGGRVEWSFGRRRGLGL
jgi:type IV secretory pathway VirD2 relaxase